MSSGAGRSARRVELPRVHKRYAVWDVATLARDYQSGVQTLLKAARFRRVWRWSTGPCPTWESPFTTPRQRWRQVLFCWLMALVTAVIIVATVLEFPRLGSNRALPASGLAIGVLCFVVVLYSWNHENPVLSFVRRQRTRPAQRLTMIDNPPPGPAELDAMGRDVLARRSAWESGTTRPKGHWGRVSLMNLYTPAMTLFYAGMMTMPLHLITGSQRGLGRESFTCAVLLIQFASMGLGLWLAGRVLRRLDRSAREPVCPDCEYDLSGVPGAFDVKATANVPVGPRRCPECGCPWPLVPPPVVG